MLRKKKHELDFYKKWLEGKDGEHYKLISDGALTTETIKFAKEYNLHIKKIFFHDLKQCKIVLKGDRNDFLCFVSKFVDSNAKFIDKIKI